MGANAGPRQRATARSAQQIANDTFKGRKTRRNQAVGEIIIRRVQRGMRLARAKPEHRRPGRCTKAAKIFRGAHRLTRNDRYARRRQGRAHQGRGLGVIAAGREIVVPTDRELQPGRLPERLCNEDKRIKARPAAIPAELGRFAARMAEAAPDHLLLIGRRHIRSNNSWLHNSKRLLKGPERCTLMIHPADADARGIADGQPVTISSRVGAVTAPAEITDTVMPGTVSLPHGWGHGREGVQLSVAATRPGVSLNDLTDRQRFDPLSGNAALNGTPVTVSLAA